jgi:DNA-binding HxlR family transcriptional regulator
MSSQHIVTAAAAKVSIGGQGGNRVAALLRRGDVVPEGIAAEQLERLIERGLIERVEVEDPPSADEVAALAAAEKADAEKRAAEEADRKAAAEKASAEAKAKAPAKTVGAKQTPLAS